METREKEVLKYLNWTGQELDKKNTDYLNKAIKLGEEISKPKFIYRKFNIKFNNHEKSIEEIEVLETNLFLTGKNINNHLKNCNSIYLLASTLGNEFDRQVNIWQKKDFAFALYLEAVGTTLIEETCNKANEEIDSLEKNTVSRFSCGYGDLPISIQPKIINILNANKTIGLTCTTTNIMIPRKSVTAIIGVGQKGKEGRPCDICKIRETCYKREKGLFCGKYNK